MSRRSVFTARERQAMFGEIVAHPYGMAAMEIARERVYLHTLNTKPMPLYVGTMHYLHDLVKAARAAARGRA